MRLHAQTAWIENGHVYLPKDAPWLLDYRQELGAFNNGRHDDQVDSTSQALGWIQRASAIGRINLPQSIGERICSRENMRGYMGNMGAGGLGSYLMR